MKTETKVFIVLWIVGMSFLAGVFIGTATTVSFAKKPVKTEYIDRTQMNNLF